MSVVGIEPTTNGLKGHCSTIELHARLRRGFYHAPKVKSTLRRSPAGSDQRNRPIYSFRLPSEIPATKVRWVRKNRTITGAATDSEAAIR